MSEHLKTQAWLALGMLRTSVLRYVFALGTVAAAILLVQYLAPQKPIPGIVTFGAVVISAWIGGLGPALLICPLVLALSRLNAGKTWSLTSQEWIGFAVISLIITIIGLAGQYRRQIKTIRRENAQKAARPGPGLEFGAHSFLRFEAYRHGMERRGRADVRLDPCRDGRTAPP